MRFRPANIRLINRRSILPRLLLALSSKEEKNNDKNKNNPTDVQRLTGSLHIRMEGNRKDLSERERVVSLCAPDPYYHVGFFELNKRI
jgi:hypothetical protein